MKGKVFFIVIIQLNKFLSSLFVIKCDMLSLYYELTKAYMY